MREGWKCPECGQCYAPWVPKCSGCPRALYNVTDSTDRVLWPSFPARSTTESAPRNDSADPDATGEATDER